MHNPTPTIYTITENKNRERLVAYADATAELVAQVAALKPGQRETILLSDFGDLIESVWVDAVDLVGSNAPSANLTRLYLRACVATKLLWTRGMHANIVGDTVTLIALN